MAQDDYVSAIDLLRDAPHNETLTLDLAQAYGKANMLDKASEVLSRALQQNPSSLALTSAMVTVLVRQFHYLASRSRAGATQPAFIPEIWKPRNCTCGFWS